MDCEVDDAEPDASRDGVGIAVPAVDEDAHMMEDVEEAQLLLAEDDEDCVDQLKELREREEEGPQATAIAADVGPRVTDGVSPAPEYNHLRSTLNNPNNATNAEDPQQCTPHTQQAAQVKGLAVLHVALSVPDKEEVES